MNTAGEYGQPLTRQTEIHAPVVAGTTTVRLRANGTLPQDDSNPLSSTQVRLINTGSSDVSVQLRECDNYADGPYSDLGEEEDIVPAGQVTQTVYPKQKYLELSGTTGTGEVKMTVISQIRYSEMAFDKGDGQYPQGIVKASADTWSEL